MLNEKVSRMIISSKLPDKFLEWRLYEHYGEAFLLDKNKVPVILIREECLSFWYKGVNVTCAFPEKVDLEQKIAYVESLVLNHTLEEMAEVLDDRSNEIMYGRPCIVIRAKNLYECFDERL